MGKKLHGSKTLSCRRRMIFSNTQDDILIVDKRCFTQSHQAPFGEMGLRNCTVRGQYLSPFSFIFVRPNNVFQTAFIRGSLGHLLSRKDLLVLFKI